MFRIEVNVQTGDRREIPQTAYRDPNDHSIIRVLDATDPAPAGMEAFDPIAVDTTTTDPVPA